MFFLLELFKNLMFFTGSYSNDCFLEPLNSKDEEECIRLKCLGDKESRNRLIEHNLRLVAHIVKKYENNYVSSDDLISIGTIGLIKGIDSFLPDKNVKITTYCAKCIENEILMFFRTNNKYSKDISINEIIGYDKDGGEISVIDVLKAPNSDFLEEIDRNDKINLILKYLKVLNKREKEVIIRRYGLFGRDVETQKELGKSLHISRSYVSRIEKKAIDKIILEFIKNNKI